MRPLRAEGRNPNRLAVAIVARARGERPKLSADDARKLAAALEKSGVRGLNPVSSGGRLEFPGVRLEEK